MTREMGLIALYSVCFFGGLIGTPSDARDANPRQSRSVESAHEFLQLSFEGGGSFSLERQDRTFTRFLKTGRCGSILEDPVSPQEIDWTRVTRVVPEEASNGDGSWTGHYVRIGMSDGRAVVLTAPSADRANRLAEAGDFIRAACDPAAATGF